MIFKFVQIIGFISLVLSCKHSQKSGTAKAENISVSKEIEPLKEIEETIKPYKLELDNSMNQVLSFSIDSYSKKEGDYNTAIGNMMADAVFERANPVFKSRTGHDIDMVLLNHGGIRSVLPKGNVTTKTAYKLMPFENSVVVTVLKGSVILEMTEYLKKAKKAHPIAGLELVLNSDDSFYKILINGEKIDVSKTYFVATSDYLYKGGDRMDFFKKSDSLYNLNYKIRNVLIDYFLKKDTLRPSRDQRFIKLKN